MSVANEEMWLKFDVFTAVSRLQASGWVPKFCRILLSPSSGWEMKHLVAPRRQQT